ncbi:glutathione S-transferase N-terminal domain-containing protein [Methylophilaceae bacterium]|nr:glutathione S-transferase N-terminal domain-containing protein [Methylophilaceae bacterium]
MYSYRRCPYAMRARLSLYLARIEFLIYEISLKNKPEHMLAVSPKGTVPVLILGDNQIIDESLDIMMWAFSHQGIMDKYLPQDKKQISLSLINSNDTSFKKNLDSYKYAYDDNIRENAFKKCLDYVSELDLLLEKNEYLLDDCPLLVDYAIFPFIRQFINVDLLKFEDKGFKKINQWFNRILSSNEFEHIMMKSKIS